MWSNSNGNYPVAALRGEVDRLFGDFFGPNVATDPIATVTRFPALNIWEDAENLYAEAEVPGLRAEDLDIAVIARQLVIKGRRADFEQQGATYHRRERGAGEFTRMVQLPIEIHADGVQARLTDGVLLITLPKAEEAKPRKIKVKS